MTRSKWLSRAVLQLRCLCRAAARRDFGSVRFHAKMTWRCWSFRREVLRLYGV